MYMNTNSSSQLQSTENFEPLNEDEHFLVTLQKDAVDPIIKNNSRGQKRKLQQQCKKLTLEKLKEKKKQKQEDLKRESQICFCNQHRPYGRNDSLRAH